MSCKASCSLYPPEQISLVAWQYINFYGRYEFTNGPTPINLDAIVEELAQRPIVAAEEEP
jgi:hypothetical protein